MPKRLCEKYRFPSLVAFFVLFTRVPTSASRLLNLCQIGNTHTNTHSVA